MAEDDEALSEALRVLSHPERRAFVRACRERERSAGELAELSPLSLPAVSEHLKVLRKSGILVLDRRGRNWMYRTDTALLARIAAAVERLASGEEPEPGR